MNGTIGVSDEEDIGGIEFGEDHATNCGNIIRECGGGGIGMHAGKPRTDNFVAL